MSSAAHWRCRSATADFGKGVHAKPNVSLWRRAAIRSSEDLLSLVGCATGLVILFVGGTSEWKIPIAFSVSVLISANVVRVPEMCRGAARLPGGFGGLPRHVPAVAGDERGSGRPNRTMTRSRSAPADIAARSMLTSASPSNRRRPLPRIVIASGSPSIFTVLAPFPRASHDCRLPR
jgi:hypothetical protein